jgi:rSAM/selenodomain-associated transferase 2
MISIIIPTYNEAEGIAGLVTYLREMAGSGHPCEIIVTDGSSSDGTRELAGVAGAAVVRSPRKGRGAQMNAGAAAAKGNILYFLHADSYPPAGFTLDIDEAVRKGYGSGCYRLSFDRPHWFLRANCWFTRFNVNAFRFGDQSLFVRREVFQKAGGFREDLVVMEDQEIIGRIRKHTRFKVFSRSVTTSARKYLENGVYRLQGVFFVIYFMYQLGFSQQQLVSTYRRLIRQDKV